MTQTRADDEREIDYIRRIMAGEGYRAVAKRYGVSNVTVQRVVREVEMADLAESGEPVRAVSAGYARPRKRKMGVPMKIARKRLEVAE